ncbi:MAG: carboxypeptidase-like regulatory domain-containing protein, partial [Planctomycetota bacterium]
MLDFDSGEPIAGAVVRAYGVHGVNLSSSREREHFATRSDAAGRFRLTGLPVGAENHLVAFTTGDVAYVPIGRNADTSQADDVLQVDFRLKQGVWAEGRVYDSGNDQPLTGQIEYYYFRNEALEEQWPGLRQALVDGRYWTNRNGEFRVPVLPTRGILAYRYEAATTEEAFNPIIDKYPRGYGAESIEGVDERLQAFPTDPLYLWAEEYHRLIEIDPAADQDVVRAEMPLFASRSIVVRPASPDGDPVRDYQVYGAENSWDWQLNEDPECEVRGLKEGERRKVFVYHRARDLVGAAMVESSDRDPVEVVLRPAGTISGRLVDPDGEPIRDATLGVKFEQLRDEKDTAVWAPHPGKSSFPTKIPVDDQGRFRLTGIVPGMKYNAWASAPR